MSLVSAVRDGFFRVQQEFNRQPFKKSVKAATTGNITLSGEQTIDGNAVNAGDRVLVKDQTDGRFNGIWVVKTGAWQRAADWNEVEEYGRGTVVYVGVGNAQGGSLWALTSWDAGAQTAYVFKQIATTKPGSAVLSGDPWKAAVNLCSTQQNVTLSGSQTVDGFPTDPGTRVLLTAQTNAVENGIWVAAPGAWTRAPDCDEKADISDGLMVYVKQGVNNWQTVYGLSNTGNPPTPGTDQLFFSRFAGADRVYDEYSDTLFPSAAGTSYLFPKTFGNQPVSVVVKTTGGTPVDINYTVGQNASGRYTLTFTSDVTVAASALVAYVTALDIR